MNINDLIMYLRKSRADNPEESVEEVLAKHEKILQDFCERQYGFRVPEENIYREVVSGESIADRVEIKKVLARVEDASLKGVLVVEPQRLSRGDLVDCGTIVNILQYTKTLVVTPVATYNMDNKMERRFFQDELLRGRDYLEYTKEILMRGKLASINRGCYLQSRPPFGYDRVKIGKDNTLTPNDDADTVRLIFDLYVNQNLTAWEIGKRLKAMGIKSPTGKDDWQQATIDKILKNYHYIGKVTYQRDKSTTTMVDGQKVTKRVRQAAGDFIIVEGKHPAIVDEDLFLRAQDRITKRAPVKGDKVLRNAFAGLLYCKKCSHIMLYKDKDGKRRYLCCKTPGCSKSLKYEDVVNSVAESLRSEHLPELRARYINGDTTQAELHKKILKSLQKELEDMKAQEETQYELLETKKYTQELFDRRNKALRERMSATETKIREMQREAPTSEVDYKERIASLTEAVDALTDDSVTEEAKNLLLKSVVERIDCLSEPSRKHNVYDATISISLRI